MAPRTAKRTGRKPAQPQRKLVPQKADSSQWIILALLVLAPLVTFAPVCWSDFTTWDDNLNVSRNPFLNPPSLEGVGHFWVSPHMALYIPVTYTVWGIVAAAAHLDTPDTSGISLNPSIFHLANLLVHVVAVLAAYQLLLALTRRRWPACAGALLFALHPVQVESVAWVAGMKDVLCGMFSLLALWQYVRFAQLSPALDDAGLQPASQRWGHYVLATLLLVLAMLSKPSAMTIPAAALVLDRWMVGRAWRPIAASLLPWAALALACAIVTHLVQPVPVPPDGGRIWARPLLAGAAVAFYLYKLVAPVWLAVQYHYSPQVLLAGRWLYVAWMIPAVLAVALWLVRRRVPWLVVAAGLFVIPILPVLGLVPFQFERYSLTADHYLYVAMIGPALALAFVLSLLHRASLKIASGVCMAVLITVAVRSELQTLNWRDTRTLFEHELAVNPDSDAADNQLAQLALDENHPAEAERLALNSIDSRPDQSEAYDLMGNAKVRQKHLDEAATWFRKTLDRDPTNYAAWTSLGGLAAEHDPQEAISLFRKAIEIEPTYESAHLNLATALAKTNRPREAVDEARTAVRLAPSDSKAHRTLGLLLLGTGRADLAANELREALRLDPNQPDVRNFLSQIPGHRP